MSLPIILNEFPNQSAIERAHTLATHFPLNH